MVTSAYTLFSIGTLNSIDALHRYNDGAGGSMTNSRWGPPISTSSAFDRTTLTGDLAMDTGPTVSTYYYYDGAANRPLISQGGTSSGSGIATMWGTTNNVLYTKPIVAGTNMTVTSTGGGTTITLASSGGGTSLWQTTSGGIQPTSSAYHLMRNGTGMAIGGSSAPFDELRIRYIFFHDGTGSSTYGYIFGGTDLQLVASADDLSLEADDDLYCQPNSEVRYNADMETEDMEPDSDCNHDIGVSAYRYDLGYIDNLNTGSCDLAELQWVAADYPPGHIVEMVAPNAELITFQAEELAERNALAQTKPTAFSTLDGDNNPNYNERNSDNVVLHFSRELRPGVTCMWETAGPNAKNPRVVTYTASVILGNTPLRNQKLLLNKMKNIAISGSVGNVFIAGAFTYNDTLVSAGAGNAIVDNDAVPNLILGYCKSNGTDTVGEVWLK